MQETKDFGEIIADFFRQTYTDTDSRFEYQAEALLEKDCINQTVGQIFELANVDYLLAAFNLDDKDFAEEFPAMSYVTERQRQQVLETMTEHLNFCPRCSLKQAYDLEFESRLVNACRQNKETLLQLLEEDCGVVANDDCTIEFEPVTI